MIKLKEPYMVYDDEKDVVHIYDGKAEVACIEHPLINLDYLAQSLDGDIDIWASANYLEDCKPEPDMLECFTNKIKIVMDVVSAVDVAWVIGGFGFHKGVKEGSKIGELTFWYSKCEKGIYRIESNEY